MASLNYRWSFIVLDFVISTRLISMLIHTPSVTSFYVQENFAPVTVHVSAVSANVTRMLTVNTLDGTVKTARHVRENVRN